MLDNMDICDMLLMKLSDRKSHDKNKVIPYGACVSHDTVCEAKSCGSRAAKALYRKFQKGRS